MDGGLSLLLTGRDDGQFETVYPDRSGLVVSGDGKGLSCVDLDHDGAIDFVVTVNDGPLIAFENRCTKRDQLLTIKLEGRPGNLRGVGARVGVERDDKTVQTAEVGAGGSYLSQSTSALAYGLGQGGHVKRIEVRWPDGKTTTTVPPAAQRRITIRQPEPVGGP
jgi:hypothetical protein